MATPDLDPARTLALRDALAAWYAAARRPLPWRLDPTPWRVWVSEIMCQQTQVATVVPYFHRFLAAFPDVRALAAAPEADVLALWAGLGYYRRCRNLQAGAREVVARHHGRIPADLDALLALPGVGRYTAGAIASIAFGLPAPLVDGNVARVLSRLSAQTEPVDSTAGARLQWALAEALLDPRAPSRHNQALMELGALVCTPRAPRCADCPLAPACAARALGAPEAYPVKRPKRAPAAVRAVCGLARRPDGAVLLARRPDDALLGGLWELPGDDHPADTPAPAALGAAFRARLGLSPVVGPHLADVDHVFTHRRLRLSVHAVALPDPAAPAPPPSWYTDLRWVAPDALASLPLSRLTQKVLTATGVRP